MIILCVLSLIPIYVLVVNATRTSVDITGNGVSLIPGLNKKVKDTDVDDKQIDYTMAIIRSMTMKERENPDIINPSRKRRIAAGCGLQVEDVNRLLNQYRSMQKLYKQLNGKNSKKMMKRMQRMGMGGGMPGGMPGGFPM